MSLRERLNTWATGDDGPKRIGRVLLPALVLLSLASFFIIGAVFDLESDVIQNFMSWAATSPLSLLIVVGVFVGFGLIGTPQFLLITVTGAVLPPAMAFGYAWVATLISQRFTSTWAASFPTGSRPPPAHELAS